MRLSGITGWLVFAFIISSFCSASFGRAQSVPEQDLWKLAKECATVHRFSTLFTAHDVQRHLSSETGLQAAIDWCKQTGVTKVYVEAFRDGYQADRATLENATEPTVTVMMPRFFASTAISTGSWFTPLLE